MVAEVLQYIADGIKIKSAEADAMYAGIVIDTNNFTNQTGVRTFEAAAFLRRNGADVTRVRKLFRDDMQDYKARAAAISSAEIYREAFSIGVCPSEGLPSPTIVCAQAANELLEIKGIKACRQNRGFWREEFERRQDPRGQDYYWLTGYFHNTEPGAQDTDEWALDHGYVSIVPIQVDLTNYRQLERMKRWEDDRRPAPATANRPVSDNR